MKEPWAMTEEEFSIRFFNHMTGRKLCTDKSFLDMVQKWHDFMKEYLDKKEADTGIKIEYPVNLHEEIIKWALEEGKTVPKKVLDEYPHLSTKKE